LVRRYRELGDEEARDRLLRANHGFVVQLARRYAHLGVPEEDLIAMGRWGLNVAIERFDHRPGNRVTLIAYASWWIRKHVLAEVRRHGHEERFAVTPPYSVRDALPKVRRAIARLESAATPSVTIDDVTAATGLPATIVVEARRLLDARPPATGDVLEAYPADTDVGEQVLCAVRDEGVRRAFTSLPGDYQRVLRDRLGLAGEVVPERALAGRMGISRRRLRRLSEEAHDALRDAFEEQRVAI
jgi:RNA polymerase sigma factor (sigma-70 family)